MKKRYLKKNMMLTSAIIVLVIIAQPKLWSLIAGGIIVLAGELIRVWATGHLKRNPEVTTSGPYAVYCRSLIPRLNPYAKSDNRKWSASLFWYENREQYFILMVVSIFVAIIFRLR